MADEIEVRAEGQKRTRFVGVGEVASEPVILNQVIVPLTNAQIRGLPSARVQIVSAPGENKIIQLVSILYELNFVSAYTGVTDASWQLVYGETANGTASGLTLMTARLAQTGHFFAPGHAPYVFGGTGTFDGEILSMNQLADEAINAGLYLEDSFGGVSDYGGGNVSNYARVSVIYGIMEI